MLLSAASVAHNNKHKVSPVERHDTKGAKDVMAQFCRQKQEEEAQQVHDSERLQVLVQEVRLLIEFEFTARVGVAVKFRSRLHNAANDEIHRIGT